MGLVDGLVQPNDLVNTARQWALDILGRGRPWVASLYKTDKLEPLGEAREILKFARAQARQRAPNLYHPLVCIDVIEAGIVAGPRAGLWKVVICLHQLSFSPLYYCCENMYDIVFNICRKPKPSKNLCSQILAKA